MTREEAIENLKGCVCGYEVGDDGKSNGNVTADLTQEIIDMAIKALKAEPCADVISRKWVLDVVNNFVFDTETDRNRIIHIVRDTAPTVIPKEKQESILDKISAEIEAEPYISKMEVLEIIERYKGESEDK